MFDQIKVDLMRMLKSKLTYAILIGQILISLLIARTQILENPDLLDPYPGDIVCLNVLTSFAIIIGYMSALISLKLSILEKKDGLLRNKIVIGTGKCGIFLSKVIVNYIFSIILFVIHTVTVIIKCYITFDGLLPSAGTIAEYIGMYLMWMFFFSILMAILALNLTSEIISIILSFMIVSVMPSLPGVLEDRIELPQYQGTFMLLVFKFIRRIVPYTYLTEGASSQMMHKSFTEGIIPAIAMSLIFLILGCLAFRRKEFN